MSQVIFLNKSTHTILKKTWHNIIWCSTHNLAIYLFKNVFFIFTFSNESLWILLKPSPLAT